MAPLDVHPDDMFDDDPTIAAFARDLQTAASAAPQPVVGAALAAVLAGQVEAPAHPGVVAPHGRERVRRSARLRWAVATATFGFGVASLGVAGALPGPVQRQVARIADVVGVNVPDGRSTPATTSTVPPPAQTVPSTVPTRRPVTPPSTVPARGNDDPSPGRSGDEHGRPSTTTTVDDRLGSGDPGRSDDRRSDDDHRLLRGA